MKQFSNNPDGTKQGTNGSTDLAVTIAPNPAGDHIPPEVRQAKALALRYRLPYVDLIPHDGAESPIDYTLLSEIPVDIMLRNQFVPLRRDGNRLHLAMADPSDLHR